MASRKILSDHGIANLKPKEATRHMDPDRGLYIRVMPYGLKKPRRHRALALREKQVWATIGGADHFTIEQAREKAREAIKRIFEKYVLPANGSSADR